MIIILIVYLLFLVPEFYHRFKVHVGLTKFMIS